jgi:uncharacterized protein YbjT (DUF2867 family)
MHTFYQMVPAAAARREHDGKLYAYTNAEMYSRPDGRREVRETSTDKARLMRVSHIDNGIAFVELGKAGDAIACTTCLPFSVVAKHEPQGLPR